MNAKALLLLVRFPSRESLVSTNNRTTEISAPSGGSSPSSTSLDKMSLASMHSFTQRQQSVNMSEKVKQI
jgi:hypothetical protein